MRLSLALLLALFAVVQSQPPSPTPSPHTHANQRKAKLEEQERDSNDETTKELIAAIHQLSTAVATNNQQQSSTQTQAKSSSDGWYKASTVLITMFTGVLAFVAVLQWRAMHRQANIAENQRKIADKQTEIAEKQFNLADAAQTIQDLERFHAERRYAEQLALAQENAATAKLSADALVAAESAWIMVDVVWAAGVKSVTHGVVQGTSTTGIAVDIIYKNEGRTLAWILEERATLMVVDSLLSGPNMEIIPLITTEPHGIAPSGKFTEERVWLACNGIAGPTQVTIVYGVVRYRDIFDRKRETTFGYMLTASNDLERLPAHRAYNRHT